MAARDSRRTHAFAAMTVDGCDVVGHCARPDVFKLVVNEAPRPPVTTLAAHPDRLPEHGPPRDRARTIRRRQVRPRSAHSRSQGTTGLGTCARAAFCSGARRFIGFPSSQRETTEQTHDWYLGRRFGYRCRCCVSCPGGEAAESVLRRGRVCLDLLRRYCVRYADPPTGRFRHHSHASRLHAERHRLGFASFERHAGPATRTANGQRVRASDRCSRQPVPAGDRCSLEYGRWLARASLRRQRARARQCLSDRHWQPQGDANDPAVPPGR
jgi:hypothetical protein